MGGISGISWPIDSAKLFGLPRQIRAGVVVHVEAEVADVVQRVLGRVDRHVALRRVQNVRHAHAAEVLQVLDSLAVCQEDAGIDLDRIKLHYLQQ